MECVIGFSDKINNFVPVLKRLKKSFQKSSLVIKILFSRSRRIRCIEKLSCTTLLIVAKNANKFLETFALLLYDLW